MQVHYAHDLSSQREGFSLLHVHCYSWIISQVICSRKQLCFKSSHSNNVNGDPECVVGCCLLTAWISCTKDQSESECLWPHPLLVNQRKKRWASTQTCCHLVHSFRFDDIDDISCVICKHICLEHWFPTCGPWTSMKSWEVGCKVSEKEINYQFAASPKYSHEYLPSSPITRENREQNASSHWCS